MATSYTSLLGLALPVQGELSGTWGDTVNDYITKYVDASVAGAQTISGSQTAVTLSTTTGTTLGQAGSGATGSAQYMIINCTGNPAGLLTITAPATSKVYVVINATSTAQSVKIVGTGPTTGVTIASGEKIVVAWNGSDFVKVSDVGDAVLANNNAFTGANTFYNATGQTFGTATAAQDGIILAGRSGGTSTYRVTLTPTTLSANRTVTLPNANTTIPVATQVITFSGPSAARTYTFPDASTTVLTTNAAVTVAQGGTGLTTLTANNVILGNGTSTPNFVAPGTSGNVLTSNGTTWSSTAPAVTLAGNNAFTGANTFYNGTGQTFGTATAAQDGIILAGRVGGSSSFRVTLTPTTLSASRTLTLPDNTGTVLTTGATVTVAQGGTGLTTLTANNVILGNGTSTPTFVAPGTSGNVLTSNGTTWTSATPASSLLGDTDSITPFETSLGFEAGNSNTGVNNTFVGYQSGKANTTGTNNTSVGYLAFTANTVGTDNTSVGYLALDANTTGLENCAVGANSLSANTTATGNCAFGASSLRSNTTGATNAAFGYESLYSNTTATGNSAFGASSLRVNTTGTNNTAVGLRALFANTTGINNTAVGYRSLDNETTGTDNTAVGHSSGFAVTTGTQNTLLGTNAGYSGTNNLTTGSNNAIIGYNAAATSATASNEVTIGNSSITRFRVPGAGIDNTSEALSGTTPSVNTGARDTYTLSTSGNTTFTFTGAPSTGQVGTFSLIITAGGTHTLTWPAAVKWAYGTVPAAPASGATNIYTFVTINAGTTWYGFLAGGAMA